MTAILGINAYHPDAAACVLVEGKMAAALAEERVGSRVKHYGGFPGNAIRRVLEMAGLELKDVDHVAFGHANNSNMSAKARYVLRHPISSRKIVLSHLSRRRQTKSIEEEICEACGAPMAHCRFTVTGVEHHLAHIASSFLASPFERAAGVSYDGSGDFVSGMYARCEDRSIEVIGRVFLPSSLGLFYTAITQFTGFERFGEEYKMMGLAAYGEPAHMDLMRRMLRPGKAGQYRLNRRYFTPLGADPMKGEGTETGEVVLQRLYSEALVEEMGPPRRSGEEISRRDMNLACSCQKQFEQAVLECLRWLHTEIPVEDLVAAGGCALNGVCNARIPRDTPFRNSYMQCAASDDGTAVGSALYVWHAVLNHPRQEPIRHAFWGPQYEEADMEAALRGPGLSYERLPRELLLDRVADHLNRGHVVGWYQGRSEWGPRALGNRSILAHPGWPEMKDLINRKVKRRESFRPFAPSILAEETANYFEQNLRSPFMMHVVPIRPQKRQALAAVCHEDGTGRLHTVERSQNPLYYDLIETFARKSGVPVVLNTSFNENEPIVDTPEQAVHCFLRNDLDVLVVGPFITVKAGVQ